MPHLPLNIDVRARDILVVGGGVVAERKIRTLLDAGASVRVVAPEMSPDIHRFLENGCISATFRKFQTQDLEGVFLAIAATNDQLVNHTIATEARYRNILVNVTDSPDLGSCTFPALLRRGDLEISVSTNDRHPAFAAEIRDLIAEEIGEEFGILLDSLATEREKLLTEGNLSTYNRKVLRSRTRELIFELKKHKERVP